MYIIFAGLAMNVAVFAGLLAISHAVTGWRELGMSAAIPAASVPVFAVLVGLIYINLSVSDLLFLSVFAPALVLAVPLQAFWAGIYAALATGALIFLVVCQLIIRLKRPVIRFATAPIFGAVLFFLPLYAQDWVVAEAMTRKAAVQEFDCMASRRFRHSLADIVSGQYVLHGWARRGEEAFVWSYYENDWVPVPPNVINAAGLLTPEDRCV